MNGNGPSDFKFSTGEDQQDAILRQKRKNRKTAKSGAGLTVFFIILLLALGGLFAFAYMDIKQRVALLEDAGERNVQEMVAEMEDQMAQVTDRYDALQKSLTKKVFPMDEIFLALESATSDLEAQLKKIESRVGSLQTVQAEKADKAALDKAVAGMTEALSPIREGLDALASRIEAAEAAQAEKLAAYDKQQAAYAERLATLSDAVQEYVDAAAQARQAAEENVTTLAKEIAALKTEMSALTAVAIDDKTLQSALNSQRAALGKRFDALSAEIDGNSRALRGLRGKVAEVEKTAEDAARELRRSPPKTIQVPPQPGTFLEQDIQ